MSKSTRYTIALVVTLVFVGIMAFNIAIPSAFSQYYTSLSTNNPTIKVTGEASIKVEQDQAFLIIAMQSPPSDITNALDEQKTKTENLVTQIQKSLGNETSVTIGQVSLNPFYSGQPSYSDINTFTIYASTAVETDVDNFAGIVKKLTEEGYSFENVYASPYLLRQSAGAGAIQTEEPIPEETNDSKKITLNVVVNTKPDTLNKVLDEYQERYNNLLKMLNDLGIASDKIKPSNVNVNPTFYGPGQNSNFNTYSQIIVKTNPKNIAAISEIINQEKTAYIESTTISISENAINAIRDELNQMALENAKQKAESLAKLAGLKVKGVQSIESVSSPFSNNYGGVTNIHGVYVIQPYYYQNVNGEIATSVTVEYELGR